jgi:hypothetical protein
VANKKPRKVTLDLGLTKSNPPAEVKVLKETDKYLLIQISWNGVVALQAFEADTASIPGCVEVPEILPLPAKIIERRVRLLTE